MNPTSPNESTGLSREVAEPTLPSEHGIDGERTIPSVNAKSTKSANTGTGQKMAGVAFVAIALLCGVAYYWPLITGKKTVAAMSNASGVAVTPKEDNTITQLAGKTPTEVKAMVDADARAAAERTAAKNGGTPPPTPGLIATAQDPKPAQGAPPTAASQKATAADAQAAAQREAAAQALLDKRRHAPLLAESARDNSGAAPQLAANSTQATAGQPQAMTRDQATAIATKVLAEQGGQRQPPPAFPSPPGSAATGGNQATNDADSPRGELAQSIRPTKVALVSATSLPNRDLILTQGTFLDCTLETALDSTVAGFTRCVTTRNTYSDSGRVILLERGTKIIGQYSGGIKQGQSRIFVLWTRAETPHGVIINLDSPGTDALGGAGLPGEIDTKFWTRFGGALLLSIIQDSFDVLKSNLASSNGDIQSNNTQQAGKNAAGIALENSINVPPVLYKNQGEKINITVARDMDFSAVYALRLSDTQ